LAGGNGDILNFDILARKRRNSGNREEVAEGAIRSQKRQQEV